jgi:hypothetical protein
MVPPEDVAPYLGQVQSAATKLPLRIGDWVGENIDVPQAAIKILRPNVIISRRYTNFVTGSTANVLLVHCSDARDLMGHYPPVCYPNQGWKMENATPRQWRVEGLDGLVDGKQYRFRRSRDDVGGLTIQNFMMLPNGRTGRDMDAIHKSASTDQHFYGAGQVQVITQSGMPEEERDRVVQDLVQGHLPVISAVLKGPIFLKNEAAH